MSVVDYIIEKLLVNPVHNSAAPPPPVGSSSGGGQAGKGGTNTTGNSTSNRTSKLSSFLHPTIQRGTNINSVSPSSNGGAANANGNNNSNHGGSSGAANSSSLNRANPAVAQLTEEEVVHLVIESRKLFMSQPMLVEIEAPVRLCGDVHGQYNDLLRLFELGGYPPENNYMFLGDYVDRGPQSLETVCLLLAYKLKYPDTFFMLRGNHESSSINRIYGFFDECKRRYSVKLWKQFTDTFNCMPVAGLVSLRVLCMHGGLSPELKDLDQIRQILRPTDVPDSGLICDLLWSDPEDGVNGWGENDRGVSWTFGANIVDEITSKFDIDLVCRAHQVVDDGYQFFANRKGITVFSAPNYCGEFDNAGAFLCVDENLLCSVIRIEPTYSAYAFY